MRFILHDEAEAELDAAAGYYETCRAGLGLEFAEEVYATIQLACAHPQAGTPVSEDIRRHLVKRFPFGILYEPRPGLIRVLAVADLRRRPGYWRKRRFVS